MSQTTSKVCGVCGASCRSAYRPPQPEIAPDLDMRPGEPARSTLAEWIQTCPRCHAAAPDLSALTAAAGAVIKSDAYRALTTTVLEETLPFRRWALICEDLGDQSQQAEALLHAAWAADDAAAMTEAARLRTEVAKLWDGAAGMERALRRLDVLRRAGLFAEAAAWAETVSGEAREDVARSILRFQQARIASRDIGRHLISSALPPPSHAPHVSHGKRAQPGFWSRLLRK
jgi:hypothetical protein